MEKTLNVASVHLTAAGAALTMVAHWLANWQVNVECSNHPDEALISDLDYAREQLEKAVDLLQQVDESLNDVQVIVERWDEE